MIFYVLRDVVWEDKMKKSEQKLNINRRSFLTGTATLAGLAATASVVPITIANANHTAGEKGLPDFISW